MATFSSSPVLPRTPRATALKWPHRLLRVVARVGVVLAMAAGSLILWAGSPLAWLWVASRVASSPTPGMGPYILLFAGLITTSVALARMLAGLDRVYRKLRDEPARHIHHTFLRASGQEKFERPKAGPLGLVMTLSVITAVGLLVAWLLHTGYPTVPLPL